MAFCIGFVMPGCSRSRLFLFPASPKDFFWGCGEIGDKSHASESENEKEADKPNEYLARPIGVDEHPFAGDVAVKGSQSDESEPKIHDRSERVDFECGDEVAVDHGGPGSCQSATWARSVEHEHARAGG